MPRWERAIDVDAPPEAAWALVGDPASVPRWYPKYVSAEVDGGRRILRRDDGGELVETLDDRDDDARRLSYSVVSGAPVASYHATFEVRAREGGSRVVWTVEAEPQDPSVDIEARLVPTQEAALRRIREIVEDD